MTLKRTYCNREKAKKAIKTKNGFCVCTSGAFPILNGNKLSENKNWISKILNKVIDVKKDTNIIKYFTILELFLLLSYFFSSRFKFTWLHHFPTQLYIPILLEKQWKHQ